MKKSTLIIVVVLLLSACNDISHEVRNAKLFDEVIYHYNDKSSREKKEAALFLFEHMQKHYSYLNENAKCAMDSCSLAFSLLTLSQNNEKCMSSVEFINRHLTRIAEEATVQYDIDHLSKEYLVNHIESSFKAWKQTCDVGFIDFDMYCNYILPYRVAKEPIDLDFFGDFRKKYSCEIDSLINDADFVSIVRSIITKEGISHYRHKYPYNNIFSRRQTSQLRGVNTCSDAIVYFVMLFRELGIPATFDYTRRCYIHPGHSMLALFWKGEWHSIEVPDGTLTQRDKKQDVQSFPKVFRAAYSTIKNGEDVTSDYTNTVKIPLKDIGKAHYPTIAIFDNEMGFYVLNSPILKKDNCYFFKDMGVDAIYAVGYTHNDRFNPSRIAFVDIAGKINYLTPNYFIKDELKLKRKYFKDKRQLPYKQEWGNSTKGFKIEGSDDINFKKCDTLFHIKEGASPYMCEYVINHSKEYKYIRVKNGKVPMHLAEFHLLSAEGNSIEPTEYMHIRDYRKEGVKNITKSGLVVYNLAKNLPRLFDGDGLSYVHIGKKGFVMYAFEKPQKIGGFLLQPRNDENHIIIGDDYELLMWDRGWLSMGRQIAQSSELLFHDIPSNGLYWLHNHSRGKEEYPFIITDKGEQYWVGQYLEGS